MAALTFLHHPSAYHLTDIPGDAARRGFRQVGTRGHPGTEAADADELLVASFLADESMVLVHELDLSYDEQRTARRSEAADTTAETRLAFDLEVDDAEDAVVLLEQDGKYAWHFPLGRETRTRRGGVAAQKALRFDIDLRTVGQETPKRNTRGLKALAKKVRGFILKFAVRFIADKTMKFLERHVERGLVVMSKSDPATWPRLGSLQDLQGFTPPADRPARVLLFVHGTFSSTVGSYGALANFSFLQDARKKYDLILGFDHPTLSEDPLENALELLRLLKTAAWTDGAVFDGIAYSRGGLVLRSLIERLLPLESQGFHFENAVFVGATNGGTLLAEPDNWHALVDRYTNLSAAAARLTALLTGAAIPAVVGSLARGLGAFVKYLATAAVERREIPGLAAMEPNGPFVTDLNHTQPGQPSAGDVAYYAVISDFENRLHQQGEEQSVLQRIGLALADPFMDQLMGEANDLVVHKRAMTTIDPDGGDFVTDVFDYGTNSWIFHTVYFTHPDTARALHTWLDVPGGAEADTRALTATRRTRGPEEDKDVHEARLAFQQLSGAFKTPAAPVPESTTPAAPERPTLPIEVVWGDVTLTPGDVYAVGHYIDILPQYAELALDRVVSGLQDAEKIDPNDLVLTRFTRQGLLRGELGDIKFFPWGGGDKRNRFVAVCGMGYPSGAFEESRLRMLHRNLAGSINALPGERRLCMVLIGSGEGSLSVEQAVRGLLYGLSEALGENGQKLQVKRVRIVEMMKAKALEIYDALERLCGSETDLNFAPMPAFVEGKGGRVGNAFRLAHLVAAAAQISADENAAPGDRQAVDTLLARVHDADPNVDVDGLRKALSYVLPATNGRDALRQDLDLAQLARTIDVTLRATGSIDDKTRPVTRLSYLHDGAVFRAAAITNTTTVAERIIDVDPALIREVVDQLTERGENDDDLGDLGDLLHGLVVPGEFRELLASEIPLILDVDPDAAALHWEALTVMPARETGDGRRRRDGFLALSRPVARQLRTPYSPAPVLPSRPPGRRTALVIGDPGDPALGHDLPGARAEALAMERLLRRYGFDVTLLLGAPGAGGYAAPGTSAAPASRIAVLQALLARSFDLIHYAGHGDFDAKDPSRSGWLFKGGLLTSKELRRVEVMPPLVFANACLSGRTSTAYLGDKSAYPAQAALLPSLADEFFRRGVRNYIGTAWEIDDGGAITFAEAFYEAFFGDREPLGRALLKARRKLARSHRHAALWAAYQHYGDPWA